MNITEHYVIMHDRILSNIIHYQPSSYMPLKEVIQPQFELYVFANGFTTTVCGI